MEAFSFSSSSISRGTCAPGAASAPDSSGTRAAASTPAGARHVAAPQHVQQVRQPPSRPLRRRARRRRRAGQRSGEEAAAAVAPRWKAPPPSPTPDVRQARRSLLLTSVRARQRVGSAQQSGRGRRTATPRGARGLTCHTRALSALSAVSQRACAAGRAQCFATRGACLPAPLTARTARPRAAARAACHGRERGNDAVSRASKAVHRGEQQAEAGRWH